MNPQHIHTTQHPCPNPARSRSYTVNFFSDSIDTVVTATPAVAREWVYNLRHNYGGELYDGALVVGLGVQWHPHSPYEASTLQLCVGSDCLIFQLCHAPAVPNTLRRLLDDDRITFVGVHNSRDQALLEVYGLDVDSMVLVDLAREHGGNPSMERMAAELLGKHDNLKPRWVGMTDWDEFWLSDEQVQYACVDAYVSYLLAGAMGYPCDDDEESYDYGYDDDEYDNYCDPWAQEGDYW